MSGGDSCASVDPSTNSTMECTTDCGCTTTSSRSHPMSNSSCASISSSPLFMSVAELTVMTGPIDHVGCARASAGVTSASSARLRPRNGPPDAVRTIRATSERRPPRRHCASAECSLSTGMSMRSRPPARSAAATTRSPPTISDSLLASATGVPTPSAASVGSRPRAPVMPFRTRSTSARASSATPASPSPTSASGSRSRSVAAASGSARARWRTPKARACSARVSTSRPAARPTTSKRSGWARTTSSAWVPIDPVEPRSTSRRRASGLVIPADPRRRGRARPGRSARRPRPRPGGACRRPGCRSPAAGRTRRRRPGRGCRAGSRWRRAPRAGP